MARYATLAADCGARIIGGCCGTQPEHLKRMREALETRPRGPRPTLDQIVAALGEFSSASDGTGEDAGGERRSRRRRRG
jgi:5-methyltetrahydrofolate--homocysteine methyltransferase